MPAGRSPGSPHGPARARGRAGRGRRPGGVPGLGPRQLRDRRHLYVDGGTHAAGGWYSNPAGGGYVVGPPRRVTAAPLPRRSATWWSGGRSPPGRLRDGPSAALSVPGGRASARRSPAEAVLVALDLRALVQRQAGAVGGSRAIWRSRRASPRSSRAISGAVSRRRRSLRRCAPAGSRRAGTPPRRPVREQRRSEREPSVGSWSCGSPRWLSWWRGRGPGCATARAAPRAWARRDAFAQVGCAGRRLVAVGGARGLLRARLGDAVAERRCVARAVHDRARRACVGRPRSWSCRRRCSWRPGRGRCRRRPRSRAGRSFPASQASRHSPRSSSQSVRAIVRSPWHHRGRP